GGCLMAIFISKRWKIANMDQELSNGNDTYLGSFTQRYLDVVIRFVVPPILGILSVLIIIEKFYGLDRIIPGWK
ncbi:MAG: hypothetical protein ACKOAR_04440, partial [Bacteroidota bacterium]